MKSLVGNQETQMEHDSHKKRRPIHKFYSVRVEQERLVTLIGVALVLAVAILTFMLLDYDVIRLPF